MYKRKQYTLISLFFIAFLTLLALLRVEAQSLNADEIVGVRVTGDLMGDPLRVIDYGTFQWAIYDKSADHLTNATAYTTPLINDPNAAFSRTAAVGLYTVQLIGPTKTEWLDQLTADGLDVVQYIHPFTYVVYGDGATMDRSARHDFVLAQGTLSRDIKTSNLESSRASQPVTVLVYRGGDVDGVSALLDSAELKPLGDKWYVTGGEVSADVIDQLLAQPAVYSIQTVPTDGGARSEMSSQNNAGNIVDGVVVPGYLAWLAEVGVDGTGVVMANVDQGVDQNHPDLVNRMLPPCTGASCLNTNNSHGTHTAGIMAGDGSSGATDGNGFLRGLGVAPGAMMFEQNYTTLFNIDGGLSQLIEESYANGAVLSSNSWGPAGTPRGYDADTLEVDISVRDADPNAEGNQEFRYVLSFMNGRGGTSSQGTPDEAKNIFTVGSTKMRTGNGSQDPNLNDLSFNTAHGPALDGRTIPHIVAPGCQVESTILNNGYGRMCGTSMASPQVSGSLALFIQQYNEEFDTLPSPALGKAAFTVVADSLAGNTDADGGTLGHPFDNKQGWGKLDLSSVVSSTVPKLYIDQQSLLTATGEVATFEINIIDPNEPVRVMLVWTDAPGHGLGGSQPAWNNDLDLQVGYEGNIYLGNQFGEDGYSVVGGSADFRNNTEAVFLPTIPPTGHLPVARSTPITISISAANLTSDGVPNNGIAIDQDFALACYNCEMVNDPIVTLEKSFDPPSVLPGELITVTLTHTILFAGEHPYSFIVTDTLPIGTPMGSTTQMDATSVSFRDNEVIWSVEGVMDGEVVNVLSYQVRTSADHSRIQSDVAAPYTATTSVADHTTTHGATSSYYVNGYKFHFPIVYEWSEQR